MIHLKYLHLKIYKNLLFLFLVKKFQNYIINNFKEKPTLLELSLKLEKSITLLGQYINKFNLKDYIKYNFETSLPPII